MAPAAHSGQTPSSPDLNNGGAIALGVRFTVAGAENITAIAFYAPATNSGTYTATLWQTTSNDDPNGSGTGTSLATGTALAASITAGAWNEISLSAPVAVTTGVVYTASVHTSSGRYVATSGGLASAITGNGVTLVADGSDPTPPGLGTIRNGVFTEGAAGSYPNSMFGQADYFVDIVLEAEGVTGTLAGTAPAVTGALTGTSTVTGALAAVTPATVAALAGDVPIPVDATLAAVIPAVTAALTGTAPSRALPTSEVVTVWWLKALTDILNPDYVATVLPGPRDSGAEAGTLAWGDDGFVQVTSLGGSRDVHVPVHRSRMSIDTWAANHGGRSKKPPWARANQLAEQIANACWDLPEVTLLYQRPVETPAAFRDAKVLDVEATEPARRPSDAAGFAHYGFELSITWTTLPG